MRGLNLKYFNAESAEAQRTQIKEILFVGRASTLLIFYCGALRARRKTLLQAIKLEFKIINLNKASLGAPCASATSALKCPC